AVDAAGAAAADVRPDERPRTEAVRARDAAPPRQRGRRSDARADSGCADRDRRARVGGVSGAPANARANEGSSAAVLGPPADAAADLPAVSRPAAARDGGDHRLGRHPGRNDVSWCPVPDDARPYGSADYR